MKIGISEIETGLAMELHPAKQAKNGLTIWSEPVGIGIEPGKTKNFFSNNSELWLSVIYPSKLEFSQYKCDSNHKKK